MKLIISLLYKIIIILKISMFNVDSVRSVKLGQINFCEKFFLKCDQEKYKITKADCDYFHEHRCEYYITKADKYKDPMLYRQDIDASHNTTFQQLAINKTLPTFECMSGLQLQKRFLTDLNFAIGERKEQWLAIMPHKALPMELFNRTKYVEVMKTDLNGFWSSEDRSEFSEFVYVHENPVKCGKTKNMIVPLKHSHRHMLTTEFGQDIQNQDNLRIITHFVVKGSEEETKCARFDPLHVSDHDKNINQMTFLLSAVAYPHSSRIYDKDTSESPFVGELGAMPSAWCRSNRVIMGLSNANLRRLGKEIPFVGAYYCSLLVVKSRERTIRLTFQHNDEEYTVKVVLRATPNKAAWAPRSIELNRKMGHARIGPLVKLKVGTRMHFVPNNNTYYSVEQKLIIGDERLQMTIGRLAIDFSDMGLESNNFAKKYYPEGSSFSQENIDSSSPGTPSNYTGSDDSSITRSTVSSMPGETTESGSCNCAPEDAENMPCDCKPSIPLKDECDCFHNNPKDLLESQNSCECTLILGT